VMARSMRARPASPTCSRMSARRRFCTSTILATAGSTRSTLSASSTQSPASFIRALIEASGRCPPEDVGGAWGYAEVLDAIGDPKHECHDEFKESLANNLDPNIAPEWLAAEVTALAKRWSRKPATKRPRHA
jgi:hypothetical protein